MNDVNKTLNERGTRYGDFTHHARICQELKHVMMERSGGGWYRLNSVQKQALDVIADKIARILSGDPNYADNWHDIQGYAKLVEDRLPKEVKVETTMGASEGLTGEWPYAKDAGKDKDQPDPLGDLPPELREVFRKALSDLGMEAQNMRVYAVKRG